MSRLLMVVILGLVLAGCHLPWIDDPAWGPDGTEVAGRCTQWEHLLEANGLPVDRFSAIAWRESRCDPGAVNRSSGARGLLQVMPQWVTRWGCFPLMRAADVCYPDALLDPGWNVYAASIIYARQGIHAWSTA